MPPQIYNFFFNSEDNFHKNSHISEDNFSSNTIIRKMA